MPREMEDQDGHVTPFYACDNCLDETLAALAKVRPIADAMRNAGLSPEVVEDTMEFLLARIEEGDEDGDPDDSA